MVLYITICLNKLIIHKYGLFYFVYHFYIMYLVIICNLKENVFMALF